MIKVLLDTNIYDRLDKDQATYDLLDRLAASDAVKIFISRTVAEELHISPFKHMRSKLKTNYVGNTVGRVGMRVGDSIGTGAVFKQHLGHSMKSNDAYIVDAAACHADWLVSEDRRLIKRAKSIKMKTVPLDYGQFVSKLQSLI